MKKLPTLFLGFLLFFAPQALWAQGVSVQEGLLTVDLREVSLISVARDIERQSGISFKGDETLLEERVSVAFENLPMEQGLKRLFSTLNYSLLFDSRGEISEIIIMSEGAAMPPSQPAQIRRPPARPGAPPQPARQRRPVLRRPGATSPLVSGERGSSAPSRPRTTIPRSAPQRPAQAVPPPPQAPAETSQPEPFRTIDSAASPGDTTESDSPLHPAFRVIERAEPPAVTVKTPEEIPKPASTEKGESPPEDQPPKEQTETSPPQN
ncbi:MAG: hypothetical protein R6X07_01385 [Desulfatiglandales bacterium]